MRGPVGLGFLVVLAAMPRESGAQLGQASTGFAFARVLENPAVVVATPGPGGLDVSLGAAANDELDLPDDQWLLDLAYAATLLGSGHVTWGRAAGRLDLQATSEPELSPPASGTGQPFYNLDSAQAGGQLYLTFTELGTLTSNTLPAGTPIQVVLNCRVDSTSNVLGSLDPPNQTQAGAGFEGRITDDSDSTAVELFLSSNEIKTTTLASAVGHVLEIRGVFRAAAEAFAGASLCCPGYTRQAIASVDASGGLWLTLPAGVGFDSASDHDYTVPVPEPDPLALALGSIVALVRIRPVRDRSR